ncbi:MAG: hypothetical protein ACLFP7_01455 [Thiohalospira sp.]
MERRRYRVTAGLTALVLVAGTVAAGDVELRQRPDGTMVITDGPGEADDQAEDKGAPEATEAPEEAGPSVAPSSSSTRGPVASGGTADSGAGASPAGYTVDIRAPEPDAVVWADDARLTVRVTVEPALGGDHRLRVTLGDHARATAEAAGEVELHPVHRGSYPLTAEVIDGDGEVVASAPPRTIHVKQHSRLHPGTAD